MNKATQLLVRASTTALLSLSLLSACDAQDDFDDADLLAEADDDSYEGDRLEADAASPDADADERESVQGDSHGPAMPDLDLALPVGGVADAGDSVKSCYWRKSSNSSGTGAIVTCGGGYQILSGGCYNTTSGPSIYKNHPWENGSIGNLPEDLEFATDVDGSNGWSCQKNSTSGTIITTGLCCKSS